MNDNRFDNGLSEIQNLIQKEKHTALEEFNQKDFGAFLDRRIGARQKIEHPTSLWFKKPVPIMASLLLILVTALILKNIFAPAPYEKSLKVFEEVLARFPNVQKISQAEEIRSPSLSFDEKAFYRFEWSLKRVLFGPHRKSIPDEEIPFLFHEVLSDAAGNMSEKLIAFTEEKPSLSKIEQEINGLRESKNFHLLFSQIIKKFQEV
jgi:hypothetical protein